MISSLNRFLSKLAKRIAPHKGMQNLTMPEMRSPEVFDSFEPEFQRDLRRFFDETALAMMDYLAVNEYWFIMMAAASLMRVDSLPAAVDDVHEGIMLLRCRLFREAERNIVYDRITNGQADRMSGRETEIAKQEGLLVWDPSVPGGIVMRINPVFFTNTRNVR